MVLDEKLRISTVNHSAEQILQTPLTNLVGLTIEECAEKESKLRMLATEIRIGFNSAEMGEWQRQVLHFSENKDQVLLLRGSHLPQVAPFDYHSNDIAG